MTDERRPRGRPRDAEVDERVHAAAEAILCDDGLAGLSMERVAREAGVGKQTLYRRYPSRLPLLLDLIMRTGEARAPAAPPPGAPLPTVRQVLQVAYGFASSPVGRAVMRAVMAEAAADETARAMVLERFVSKRRALLRDAIVRETGRSADEAAMLTELAFGFMWSRLALDAGSSDDETDRVLSLLGMVL